MRMNDGQREFLGQYLASIAYCTARALRGPPPVFGDFPVGHGVRAPREIFNRMRGRILFLRGQFRHNEGEEPPSLG